jgi:hypothetical protein
MGHCKRIHVPFVALLAFTLLVALAATACGGDRYSGTWHSTALYNSSDSEQPYRTTLVIAKAGDDWKVTDGLGRAFTCRETREGLVQVLGPSGSPVEKGEVLQRDGDELVLFTAGGEELERFARE